MADPISIMGLTATVAGGATSAIGSIFGGEANAAMYNYQASVAQMNAQIARQNAAYEMQLGETQQVEQGMKIRGAVGQARANQGAGGLDVNSGSAAEVRESMIQMGKIDQATIISNARRRAYGDQVEAVQDVAQSGLDKMAASTSQTSGVLGAFSSILSAGSTFSSRWMQMQSVGNNSLGSPTPLMGAW